MNATTYQMNKLLNYVFGGVSYTPPSNWYLGLSKTLIDATGNTVTEPDSGTTGYARVAIPNNKSTGWTTSTLKTLSNLAKVTFGESDAPYGTIVSMFLADALTGGNVCYYYTANPAFPVGAASETYFDIGKIVSTLA
jgi:hypothetical protein